MGKLVRDNIPSIILLDGHIPKTRLLDDSEYEEELLVKLREEADELAESGSIEEIADIIEVLMAYVKAKGKKFSEVEKLRVAKLKDRGGFRKKIYLEEVD